MIEATDIAVAYDGTLVLNGVGITARPGQVVGLIGPNGSGKTTLLRTLYRSLKPRAGLVTLDDQPIEALATRDVARRVAVVAQEGAVELPFTVAEMVLLGRSPTGRPSRATPSRTTRSPHQPSSGWAPATSPSGPTPPCRAARSSGYSSPGRWPSRPTTSSSTSPTNHLDVRYQHEVLALVRSLDVATVVVLHDLNLAARYCDRLVLLDGGRVTFVGGTREVLTPEVLEPVYGVAVRCLDDGDAVQLVFRGATTATTATTGRR